MNFVQKHIRHYNKLNGQPVRRSTLQNFLNKVKGKPGLEKVADGLSRALKAMGKDDAVRLEVTPITYTRTSTTSLNGLDTIAEASMLHGLPYIQDDTGLEAKPLDGINDTAYKVITDRILELIKAGGLIWRKPWNENVRADGDTDLAHNYVTKHIYRGGNYYLNYLRIGLKVNGKLVRYNSPYFFSFKQVNELKGKVIAGEKGWPVMYFKWLFRDDSTNALVPEDVARDKSGKLRDGYTKIPGVFYYNVFNYEQTEGLKLKPRKALPKRTAKERIESAEQIIAGMPKRPPIYYKGVEAFYRPSRDEVHIPPIEHFDQEQHFYSVTFHELVHSTGHQSRVGREMKGSFGSRDYAFEELIAELGASFLCGESGILYFTMKNSAAYIKGWSKRLVAEMEKDPKFYLRAASQAQKAADFMMARGEYEKLKETPKRANKSERKPAKKDREPVKMKAPENKTSKPRTLVKKKRQGVDGHPTEVTRSEQKPVAALAGFTTADQAPRSTVRKIRPKGVIGELIGEIQPYKLAIIVPGETHSSKSELGKQIVNALIPAMDEDAAILDWEQGGMEADVTKASIARNIDAENISRVHVTGEYPRTLEALKELSKRYKIVLLDSGTKLKEKNNDWIDWLRENCPHTVWIILMQQTTDGKTRGGAAAEFDAPVVLKTYRPDERDFRQNYAHVFKNRGNRTGLFYNIAAKQMIQVD